MKSFLALHWCDGAMVVIIENSLLTGRDMLYVAYVGVGRPIGFTYSSLVFYHTTQAQGKCSRWLALVASYWIRLDRAVTVLDELHKSKGYVILPFPMEVILYIYKTSSIFHNLADGCLL
jgi:hypothetical protein